jgi:hypothetical protein
MHDGRGCWRSRGSAGYTQTPETGGRFGELQFDVATGGATGFGFENLADDFLFRFFVGEENELARRERSGKANDSAMRKNENGLRGLGERLALIGTFDGACTIDGHGNFEGNGLRTSGRFVGRFAQWRCWSCRGGGGCGCCGSFGFFQNRRHRVPTQRGIEQESRVWAELSRLPLHGGDGGEVQL